MAPRRARDPITAGDTVSASRRPRFAMSLRRTGADADRAGSPADAPGSGEFEIAPWR